MDKPGQGNSDGSEVGQKIQHMAETVPKIDKKKNIGNSMFAKVRKILPGGAGGGCVAEGHPAEPV